MEQQQNSKNQQGQQNKMPPTGNATQDDSMGATQGMPKTFQNEKSTQSSAQGQSQFGQAGQENEQTDKNNTGFPPDLQMNKQVNQHDKSTEVSESQQNPNEQGSSNKGSVNMGQQRSGEQSQQTPSQNK